MARKRNKENIGLPPRWRYYHGAYYYQVPPGCEAQWDGKKQFKLGVTLSDAYREWSKRMAATPRDIATINDALDRYALEVLPLKAPATQREQARIIPRLKAVFGHMPPADFRPVDAYGYRDRRGRESPHSANRELEVLSHAFTKMIEWGALEAHPMIEGKFRKLSTPARKRYVEDWEVREALALTPLRKRGSVRMCQAYIKLKLLTGLRRTDLLALRITQFSDDGITVTHSKTAHSSGKTTTYQWDTPADADGIPRKELGLLWNTVQECLRARPLDIGPQVFCNALGESYLKDDGSANGFDSIWQRFMDRVLAETKVTVRFWEKDLRAKAGSDAESLERARALLGHANASTTRKIYRRKPENVPPGRLPGGSQ